MFTHKEKSQQIKNDPSNYGTVEASAGLSGQQVVKVLLGFFI